MGGGERPRHMVEGMLQKHLLSTGMAAFPGNSDGLPFDCSHVYASGNLAADMFANVTAESTGRLLAVRLFNAAHDEGMRDMLSFLIARDTMHQQQWLAVVEELGGSAALPIPNSFDQSQEKQEYSYVFLATNREGIPPAAGRWNRRAVARRQEVRSRSGKTSHSATSRCLGRHVPTVVRSASRWVLRDTGDCLRRLSFRIVAGTLPTARSSHPQRVDVERMSVLPKL